MSLKDCLDHRSIENDKWNLLFWIIIVMNLPPAFELPERDDRNFIDRVLFRLVRSEPWLLTHTRIRTISEKLTFWFLDPNFRNTVVTISCSGTAVCQLFLSDKRILIVKITVIHTIASDYLVYCTYNCKCWSTSELKPSKLLWSLDRNWQEN